MSHGTC